MAERIVANDQPTRQNEQVALQSANAPFKLTPRQQSVYDSLLGKTESCAKMYFGAMMILADQNNPERLYLVAHSLRELMNNIGPHLNIPIANPELKKGQGKLGDRFDEIGELLLKAEKAGANWDGKQWAGKIHKCTQKLLTELQRCVKWRALNKEFHQTSSDALLNKFDPLHRALPKEIQSMHIREWETTRTYFVRVAHHDTTDFRQLGSWLLQLEEMLLKGLTPRAKVNLAEVDAIIEAGEKHD